MLWEKYKEALNTFHLKVITEIVYNDETHLVSLFKDYLLYDDTSEFLKRSYNLDES